MKYTVSVGPGIRSVNLSVKPHGNPRERSDAGPALSQSWGKVKAGTSGTLKSLHLFVKERNLAAGVRVNLDTPSVVRCSKNQLLSLPCYMVDEILRLLDTV